MTHILFLLAFLIPSVTWGSPAELAAAGMPGAADPDYKVALIKLVKGDINPADFHQADAADVFENGALVWDHRRARHEWQYNPLDRFGVGRIVRSDVFDADAFFPLGVAVKRFHVRDALPGFAVVPFHRENDCYDGHLGLRIERTHAVDAAAMDMPEERSNILQSVWTERHFAEAGSFPILALQVAPCGFYPDGALRYRLSPVGEGICQIRKETAAELLVRHHLPE